MEWLRVILVSLLMTRAIYTDMRKGIIENRCMILGLLLAYGYSFIRGGGQGLLEGVSMSFIMMLALFVLFILKGLGAGDIKLLCVLAAFYPEDAMGIVMISFIVAAGIVLGRMLVRAIQKQKIYVSGETIKFSIPIGIAMVLIEMMHRV